MRAGKNGHIMSCLLKGIKVTREEGETRLTVIIDYERDKRLPKSWREDDNFPNFPFFAEADGGGGRLNQHEVRFELKSGSPFLAEAIRRVDQVAETLDLSASERKLLLESMEAKTVVYSDLGRYQRHETDLVAAYIEQCSDLPRNKG